ncbi:MAG: TIGR00159 family protein [Candidatus Omnitrophota bacterium]|nr:MAG: TIGR00159 family protein [Candidatus Omnitrophota bacterium]
MRIIHQITFSDIVDIIIISCIIYYLIIFLLQTKGFQLLKGILILFIITFFAQFFHLTTLHWVLEKVFALGMIALVIIFQPELRNVLRKLGTEQLLPFSTLHLFQINQLIEAVKYFCENKIGSTIVLERTTPLGSYTESGVKIDSNIDKKLLISIFNPGSPLHDGAVIIRHNRISAAGCILPVEEVKERGFLGTRHISAIKLSEETDAIVIVTSEETGKISIAEGGNLYQDISIEELRKRIEKSFHRK